MSIIRTIYVRQRHHRPAARLSAAEKPTLQMGPTRQTIVGDLTMFGKDGGTPIQAIPKWHLGIPHGLRPRQDAIGHVLRGAHIDLTLDMAVGDLYNDLEIAWTVFSNRYTAMDQSMMCQRHREGRIQRRSNLRIRSEITNTNRVTSNFTLQDSGASNSARPTSKPQRTHSPPPRPVPCRFSARPDVRGIAHKQVSPAVSQTAASRPTPMQGQSSPERMADCELLVD